MAQALMAQWRAGMINDKEGYRDTSRGRLFINVEPKQLPIEDGAWVIITTVDKHGIRLQPSTVPFGANYKIIDNAEKLFDLMEGLKPFVHRLFWGRVAEGLNTQSKGGYRLRVNGFDQGGFFYLNSEAPIPAGSIVEILKGSHGYVLKVAVLSEEEAPDGVSDFPTWHKFVEAAMRRVRNISPMIKKSVLGVITFDIAHRASGGDFMTRDTVDVPDSDGLVSDVFLIHEGEGPVLAGEAIRVWVEGDKLYCVKTQEHVSAVYTEIQDIVDELRPKLSARPALTSPENGIRVTR